MDQDRRPDELEAEVEACRLRLDALSIERRRLEVVGLRYTPEYDQIAAEWDRARMAHYHARSRAGDDSDKFMAEMVCIGYSPVTAEEMARFIKERDAAAKSMEAILSGNYDEE